MKKTLITAFGEWLQQQRLRVSAKSRPGEKLAYIHRHWDGLQTFLHDGRVEIDSNNIENLIRPIALNSKNALFAGHDDPGSAGAVQQPAHPPPWSQPPGVVRTDRTPRPPTAFAGTIRIRGMALPQGGARLPRRDRSALLLGAPHPAEGRGLGTYYQSDNRDIS